MTSFELSTTRGDKKVPNWLKGTALAVGFAAMLAMSPGQAEAAPIACGNMLDSSGPVADKVQISTDCQVGSSFQDSETNVNSDEMFGFTDWTFAGKQNVGGAYEPGDPFDSGLLIGFTDGLVAGTWEVNSDIWDDITHLMLTFVDGNPPGMEPPGYVGYLILTGETSGTWESMFQTPHPSQEDRWQTRDMSHISAFVRLGETPPNGNGNDVPAPATLFLFGVGLLGLGLIAHQRRRRFA